MGFLAGIPTNKILPRKPKNITEKSIQALEKIEISSVIQKQIDKGNALLEKENRELTYKQVRKELENQIKGLRELGYLYGIPDEKILPKIPNVITEESIQRLYKVDLKKIVDKQVELGNKLLEKQNIELTYNQVRQKLKEEIDEYRKAGLLEGVKDEDILPKIPDKPTESSIQKLFNVSPSQFVTDRVNKGKYLIERENAVKRLEDFIKEHPEFDKKGFWNTALPEFINNPSEKSIEKLKKWKPEEAANKYKKTTLEQEYFLLRAELEEKGIENIPEIPNRITKKKLEELKKLDTSIQEEVEKQETEPDVDNNKQPEDSKKPKEKTQEEKEKIVDEFYDNSEQEKGEKEPPKETDEIISNLEDILDNKYVQGPTPLPEKLVRKTVDEYYSEEQLEYEIKNVEDKLENFEPLDWWSQNPKKGHSLGLISIKQSDVNEAKATLQAAIESIGREEVAKNIAKNSGLIDEILREILYRGSGNDFIAGRTAVQKDLTLLGELLLGGKMDAGTSLRVGEFMEQYEYEDVLE